MSAADSVNAICTPRIELRDSDPLIWRQVEVPTSVTLKGLHDVVQAAMGGSTSTSGSSASARDGSPANGRGLGHRTAQ